MLSFRTSCGFVLDTDTPMIQIIAPPPAAHLDALL
jgi:hypothetical protein